MSRAWKPFYMRPKFLLISGGILVVLVVLQLLSGLASKVPTVSSTEAQGYIQATDKPFVLAIVEEGNVVTRGMISILSRVAEETGDSVRYGKVSLNDAPELKKYTQTMPTVLVFNRGKLVAARPIIENKEDLLVLLRSP